MGPLLFSNVCGCKSSTTDKAGPFINCVLAAQFGSVYEQPPCDGLGYYLYDLLVFCQNAQDYLNLHTLVSQFKAIKQ